MGRSSLYLPAVPGGFVRIQCRSENVGVYFDGQLRIPEISF